MNTKEIAKIENLLRFFENSPTAWHAVQNCTKELIAHGFTELHEGEDWLIKTGGRYFVTRNGSSICAFVIPKSAPKAIHLAAAHTDSPSFKLKPNAEFVIENMRMLGLEIYGAPIIASWLNRDLGIAGRIIYTDPKGKTHEKLVKLSDYPVVLPQLAIHLDRTINEQGVVIHKQDHLAALACIEDKKEKKSFLERILKNQFSIKELLAYDLFLFPLEKPRLLGENQELVASYRIDNLASVHASLESLIAAKQPSKDLIKMMVLWDNEEIGSNTAQGASSPFIAQTIERITLALNLSRDEYFQLISRSLCASVDLGHALHPNYKDKHEPRHMALLDNGVIIKTNAQNRYSSDARSTATMVSLCHKHKIPFQKYMSRGDIPCGTTVGPIHAYVTGMPTIDIGISQLSMHSCREIMSAKDHLALCNLLTAFFE
ncbi:MAG TPA: M18 family aminopeptidase [Parachlamydiaceae bacterium]|nr:M18 family aminopeptidase [Parachlamydiaceae bacterium]